MRIKKLDERVRLLRAFMDYADADYTILPLDSTESDLVWATEQVQMYIKLPIYTVAHAAAWLGLSKRGVVEAYRAGRLPYIQPGREVLFIHEALVEFAKERRYEL